MVGSLFSTTQSNLAHRVEGLHFGVRVPPDSDAACASVETPSYNCHTSHKIFAKCKRVSRRSIREGVEVRL